MIAASTLVKIISIVGSFLLNILYVLGMSYRFQTSTIMILSILTAFNLISITNSTVIILIIGGSMNAALINQTSTNQARWVWMQEA